MLISVYRPKIHIIKLRNSAGPNTRQSGIIGNCITFPQDIVQIASKLPANPDIFVDHLKVVFLGSTRPTQEALKKIFTVRREKVYNAVQFLRTHHHLYRDVVLSTVNLPDDDIPAEILNLIDHNEDPENEAANANSTYTPQTDLIDVPSDDIAMTSSGMID